MTSPGMVLGTIAYMAPEQLRADAVDHRVDLFALGVVLYELLTARLPFRGATLADTFDRIFHAEPEPVSRVIPGVLPELERIVRKALQKSPTTVTSRRASFTSTCARWHAGSRPTSRRQGLRAPIVETGQRSIAVLTFTNVTRDASDDWIGTGIAETVTADLKNVQNLAVIGRGQISELLNCDATVGERERASAHRDRAAAWRVVGGVWRLSARWASVSASPCRSVEVLTGKLIRTVKVDGRVDEIFELQDRIVFDVSRGLDLKLGREDAEAIERDETRSVEAFEAYSRGVLNLRSAGREAMDRAIGLFERAVTLDPTYATAWSALGGAYYLKGMFLGLRELHHKAMEQLQRAIALNPALANAHVWLGSALLQLGEIDKGIHGARNGRTPRAREPGRAPDARPGVLAVPRDGPGRHRGIAPIDRAQFRERVLVPPAGDARSTEWSSRRGRSGGATGDRAAGARDVGHRGIADCRRTRAPRVRAVPAWQLRRSLCGVSARAGVRHDERPRATRTNAHRAASEIRSTVSRTRRLRGRAAIRRHGHRGAHASGGERRATTRRRATTWPPCMQDAATSSARASIWRCRFAACLSSRSGVSSVTRISIQ